MWIKHQVKVSHVGMCEFVDGPIHYLLLLLLQKAKSVGALRALGRRSCSQTIVAARGSTRLYGLALIVADGLPAAQLALSRTSASSHQQQRTIEQF